MAKLTPEQKLGNKFEIWLEQLFNDLDRKAVRGNVVYCKSRFVYRQVDIEFRDYHLFNSLVIVEAKYLCKYGIPPIILCSSRAVFENNVVCT